LIGFRLHTNRSVGLPIEQCSFCCEPASYPVDAYIEARDSYIKAVRKLPGLVSIYQMGGLAAPGISDIDLILVFDDEVKGLRRVNFGFDHLSPLERYLFMQSSPFLVCRSVFDQLHTFFFPTGLTCLDGQAIRLASHSEEYLRPFRFLFAVDMAVTKLIWFSHTILSRKIPLRETLCQLHSVTYNIQSVKTLMPGAGTPWRSYEKQIAELRDNWFQSNAPLRKRTCFELMLDAIQILFSIAEILGSLAEREGMCVSDDERDARLMGLNFCVRFSRHRPSGLRLLWRHHNLQIQSRLVARIRALLYSFQIDLPVQVSQIFAGYASHPSPLGRRVKSRYYPARNGIPREPLFNPVLRRAVDQRMQILEKYRAFLDRNEPSYSLMTGPWFGKSTAYQAKRLFWRWLLRRPTP
jgi:hypothetical protein